MTGVQTCALPISSWQVQTFHALYEGQTMEREDALIEMTRRYLVHMRTNEPVHTWPLP